MKGFHAEKYPISLTLVLCFSDGEQWEDGIKGLNVGHALWRARQNWDGVTIVSYRKD